jgi:N-acetylglucosamine-6-phosphate deacetylase
MRQALKNIVHLGVPVHEAVSMTSLVPARVAGIESEFGLIKEGMRAELIAFDDEFAVRSAVIGGSLVPLPE